jgi:solute carrier family 25 carnitine/acylcarnitine transporter 20/29
VATLARDGPGSAAYFATYEYTKRKLTPEGQQLSLPAIIMAGGLAGIP